MSLLQIKVTGWDGVVWNIRTAEPAHGLVLDRPTGLVARVDRSTTSRTTGVGVRVGGYSFPAMTGALQLRVHDDPTRGQSLGEVYDGLLSSLSVINPAGLQVTDGRGREWQAGPVLLANHPDPSATSPHTPGLQALDLTVELFAEAGVWSRVRKWGNPAGPQPAVVIVNDGDLPVHPSIRWNSSVATSITTPYGQVVSLPRSTGWRTLSTDPGTGYIITTDAGVDDPNMWAAMRGLPVLGRLAPGGTATWSLPAGVELTTTEYRLNPWR